MKPILSLIVLLACGCSSITKEQRFAERIVEKVTSGNETFWVEIQTKHLDFKLARSNPTIGFSASAGKNGITHNSQTNLGLSVAYHAIVPSPSMPQSSTNQPTKAKP